MQNKYFCQYVNRSGFSLYKIAKVAGIPYTTINQLYRGKTDINHVQAQTVYKLASILHCRLDELLNPFDFLTGTTGTAQGVNYTWGYNGKTVTIQFIDQGQKVVLNTNMPIMRPSQQQDYTEIADMCIEDYFKKQKAQSIMKRMLDD